MHVAGERAVAAAQADGRWDAAYAGPSKIEVPDDPAAAANRAATYGCPSSGGCSRWQSGAASRRLD